MTSESLDNPSLADQLNEAFTRPSGREFNQMRQVEFKRFLPPNEHTKIFQYLVR